MYVSGALVYWLCVWLFLYSCQGEQIVLKFNMEPPFEAVQSGMQRVKIEYTHNGVYENFQDILLFQNASAVLPSLAIDLQLARIDESALELSYTLTAQAKVVRLHYLEFLFDMDLQDLIMMADGYQAWTHSREADKYSRIPPMSKTVAWWTKFDLQGDYWFFPYSGRMGVIHSTSYTYLKNMRDRTLVFFGSISENSGYTYFRADLNGGLFSIYKDIEGKELLEGETLELRVIMMHRKDTDLNAVWERFAQYYLHDKPLQPRHLTGWTSWYNYYERVTEQDVLNSLTGFKQHGYSIDVFQIDDGYQVAVGDWLDIVESKFPKGMGYLAKQISDAGYIPGLWLAPYAVGFKSRIVKEHPEWLVKHDNGSFLVAGPNWGGFYALNIYNAGAREYLRKVFNIVLDEWGYRLLKLDFIFAAAMLPQQGKSRGEILWESIDLIQELTRGRAMILGSGIPLAATWGKFDYCRVSSDASPYWDQTTLRVSHVRERVATNNALTSTLHRWYMTHVFGTDPDVFLLRSNNNKLNNDERYTTCTVNNIMGQLTLMSDDVQKYSAEEHRLYASTFPKVQAHVESSETIGADVYCILYTANGRRYRTYVNMSPLPHYMRLPDEEAATFFEQQNPLLGDKLLWHKAGDQLLLKPHETRTFLHITDRFAGSTGHLVPGWDIESFQEKENTIQITMRQGRQLSDSYIFMLRLDNEPDIYIDGSLVTAEQYLSSNGVRLIRVKV